MNLREWASNEDKFNNSIPIVDKAEDEIMKVLGISWNRKEDTIEIKKTKNLRDSVITKCTVLKQVASVYDPLGLFSPITLRGKLLLQKLWIKHLEWDDPLEEDDIDAWISIRADLISISDYKLPRCVTIGKTDEIESFLACFCDASSKAYAATVYLVQHGKQERKAELLFTKSRLAPTTSTTIPRLELMAVVIGVRCVEFVRSQLTIPIKCIYLFTDSQCTLKWITTTKQLSVFVNNRVKEIRSHKEITFHYINTTHDPADLPSRGCSMENLSEHSLWWHGPELLVKPEEEWPLEESANATAEIVQSAFDSEIEQDKNSKEYCFLSERGKGNEKKCFPLSAPFEIDIERLTKLLRVTATALRFVKRLKGEKFTKSHLTEEDIHEAESMWVSHIQRNEFEEVFQSITGQKNNNLQMQLGLFIDEKGILRCKGRLENAELTVAARFPILIPSTNKFSHLVIESVHKKLLHSGVSQTLSQIRYKFWVPHGRATVKKVISSCLVCRRLEGGPYKSPPMAPLPHSRVSESVPFTHTGIDYMGPLYIKVENENKKVWVCLFTCMVTRAVHLELVSNMSTSAFLNCLRRFVASRGTPSEIISDNAMHFKSAKDTIELLWTNVVKCDDVQSYCANKEIKWSFIVQLAPWMGGFYERLVGLTKRALRKAIGRNMLDMDKLHTVLKEAEAVVNSRPLVYVGDDINSTIVITPGHFICLNPRTGILECDPPEKDPDFKPKESSVETLLQIWKKGQKLLDNFWKIWHNEYLTSSRERTQTKLKSAKHQAKVCVQIGYIVLIKDNLLAVRTSGNYNKKC